MADPNMPELKSPLATPESVAAAVAKLRATEPNLALRGHATGNLLFQLTQQGFLQEAWDLIDPGFGVARSTEVRRIMESTQVPVADRVEFLAAIPDEEDVFAGVTGLVSSMSKEQIVAFDPMQHIELGKTRDLLCEALVSGLSDKLKFIHEITGSESKGVYEPLISKALELMECGLVSPNDVGRVLGQDPVGGGFDHWELVSGLADRQDGEGLRQLQLMVINKMIREDAGRAAEVMVSFDAEGGHSHALPDAIASWYRQDSGGANRWMTQRGVHLPAQQRNRLISRVVEIAEHSGDHKTALGWALQVTDEAMKKGIIGDLQPHQND